MTTLTASEARANLYRKAIQETLFLLSIPGMRESIKEGMAEPLNESVKELDW